jgi:hypothetical protein
MEIKKTGGTKKPIGTVMIRTKRHSILKSDEAALDPAEAVGAPHPGQLCAFVETSFPHSLHFLRAIIHLTMSKFKHLSS